MKNIFIKWFMTLNSFLIRLSRGRIGSRLGAQTILLLQTVGRKSGKPRTTPIAYFDYEGKCLLVASNWGRDRQADWFLNLQVQPRAQVQVNGKTVSVTARVAQGEEYARLWKFATERHPPYLNDQRMTKRPIPIVMLEPV
jgi:deazaflavin-dependent oxidoreductase (nitroreductase family)